MGNSLIQQRVGEELHSRGEDLKETSLFASGGGLSSPPPWALSAHSARQDSEPVCNLGPCYSESGSPAVTAVSVSFLEKQNPGPQSNLEHWNLHFNQFPREQCAE